MLDADSDWGSMYSPVAFTISLVNGWQPVINIDRRRIR
jgi:hypothetical protein